MFLNLIKKVVTEGITDETYQTRGILMLDFLNKKKQLKSFKNMDDLNCASAIDTMDEYLRMRPSISVTKYCENNNCDTNHRDTRIHLIDCVDFFDVNNFQNFLSEYLYLSGPCSYCKDCMQDKSIEVCVGMYNQLL